MREMLGVYQDFQFCSSNDLTSKTLISGIYKLNVEKSLAMHNTSLTRGFLPFLKFQTDQRSLLFSQELLGEFLPSQNSRHFCSALDFDEHVDVLFVLITNASYPCFCLQAE